jgi:hypothetical protein
MDIADYTARTARVANYLDRNYPGWEHAVKAQFDEGTFDMSDPTFCIAGAIFFKKLNTALQQPTDKGEWTDEDDMAGGFWEGLMNELELANIHQGPICGNVYVPYWELEIAKRLNSQVPVTSDPCASVDEVPDVLSK